MKKISFLMMLLIPAVLFAQKAVKPNLNKALSMWQEGKLAEAKEMIDACTTYEKTMNDGKTWYYKALIYASLDTTSNEAYKALSPNPLDIAMESLQKADQMAKPGSEYFVNDASGFPVTRTQQIGSLNGYYLNKGVAEYQEEDYENSMINFEKSQRIAPDDTTGYYFAGIVAQNMENWDKAIVNINAFIDKGGKSPDAYLWLINIYNNYKTDKNKALEVAREAKAKFPEKSEFSRFEIGLLIDLDKIDEAKVGLEQAVKEEPDNKTLHFFLGYTYLKQNMLDKAKISFEESLRIDPQYFDAQFYLAKVVSEDAKKIKKEMNNLGISADDKKKRFELDKVYVEKLKVALPYWEKAEKLNPSDQEVLDELYSIYADLDMQPQMKRIEKRYKELGIE
jgi:tetratricopeptide (TPR) repeat protein